MAKGDKRKPRKNFIYGTTAGKVTEIEVTYDLTSDGVRFGGDMVNIYSEVTYDRRKSEKVLSRIPQSMDELSHSQDQALEKNYDVLCAVDTNTRVINGERVSIVGLIVVELVFVPDPEGLVKAWRYESPFCLEFVDIKGSPENFGWIAAIEELRQSGVFQGKGRIGVIVDSDLGNIADFNSRTKPVFAEVTLPQNVQLIYASADAGKENLVNKMISMADSISSKCLKMLQSGTIPFNKKNSSHPWYARKRIIKPA